MTKMIFNLNGKEKTMYAILIVNSEDEVQQTIQDFYSGAGKEVLDRIHPAKQIEALHCRINTAKGIYNIPHKDILFVESGQKKSIIHLTNHTICLPVPLYRIREVLPAPYFVQTHRSYICNLRRISFIDKTKDPWVISFFGSNKTAFISRSFKKDVIQAINPFLDCIND